MRVCLVRADSVEAIAARLGADPWESMDMLRTVGIAPWALQLGHCGSRSGSGHGAAIVCAHTGCMPPRVFALGFLIASAASALAAPFMTQHGHWTVMAGGPTACMAVNRPPEEFNVAPFNALSLRQRRGAQPVLQVFTWPDMFKPGQTVTITFTINGTRTEAPAQTADSYIAETKGALPAELIAMLRGARSAQIEITGFPHMLLFDVSDAEAVLASLEACERQLPRR